MPCQRLASLTHARQLAPAACTRTHLHTREHKLATTHGRLALAKGALYFAVRRQISRWREEGSQEHAVGSTTTFGFWSRAAASLLGAACLWRRCCSRLLRSRGLGNCLCLLLVAHDGDRQRQQDPHVHEHVSDLHDDERSVRFPVSAQMRCTRRSCCRCCQPRQTLHSTFYTPSQQRLHCITCHLRLQLDPEKKLPLIRLCLNPIVFSDDTRDDSPSVLVQQHQQQHHRLSSLVCRHQMSFVIRH